MSKKNEEKQKEVGVIVAAMVEVEISDLGTRNLDYHSWNDLKSYYASFSIHQHTHSLNLKEQ